MFVATRWSIYVHYGVYKTNMLRSKGTLIFIFLLYFTYGALSLAAFMYALEEKHRVFTLLVPTITNSLHLIFVVAAYYKEYEPWPVQPRCLYKAVDVLLVAVVAMCVVMLAIDAQHKTIAIVANVVTMIAVTLCIRKTYKLLHNMDDVNYR